MRFRGRAERLSAAARAVLLDIAVEVRLVRLEVGRALLVGEVEEVVRRRGIDARHEGRLAGVADRARRQPGMRAGVVRRVQGELGSGWLWSQPAEGVEQRRVHAELDALAKPVVVNAADVAAVARVLVV